MEFEVGRYEFEKWQYFFVAGLFVFVGGIVCFDIIPNSTREELIIVGSILIFLVILLIILGSFFCQKWIINSRGCTFVFPFFKRQYRWREFKACWKKQYPDHPDIEIFYVSTTASYKSGVRFEEYANLHPLTTFYICFAPDVHSLPRLRNNNSIYNYRYLSHYVNSIHKEKFYNLLEFRGVEVVDISGYKDVTWKDTWKSIKKQSDE